MSTHEKSEKESIEENVLAPCVTLDDDSRLVMMIRPLDPLCHFEEFPTSHLLVLVVASQLWERLIPTLSDEATQFVIKEVAEVLGWKISFESSMVTAIQELEAVILRSADVEDPD